MDILEGGRRDYPWGSPTAIPEQLGLPGSGEPVAELWLGAHPADPAAVGPDGRSLDAVIATDPELALGTEVASRFGSLPFLFKVLAAHEPLSLQAHPDSAQAVAGFDREEAAGVAIDAPERFFRDRNHKPELVCALSTFEALHGFREAAATLDLLDTIGTSALDPLRQRIAAASDGNGLRATLAWLLTLDPGRSSTLITRVAEACAGSGPDRPELAVVVDMARRHPDDPAVVATLLLNHVRLDRGQGLYVGPGTLHCHLGGLAVEVMANSDNVLRGGLTTKPVDVATLLEIVDTTPGAPGIQDPIAVDGVVEYDCPTPEFSLQRLEPAGDDRPSVAGPAVLLCVDGVVDAGPHVLDRGTAAWVSASEPPVELAGAGTLYRAGVGDLALH